MRLEDTEKELLLTRGSGPRIQTLKNLDPEKHGINMALKTA